MIINEEYQILINKAVDNAPTWLTQDLEQILKKSEVKARNSYIISELHSRYTSGIRHITSAMAQSSEWSITAHDRLNFIDNNIDLILYIVQKMTKK